MHIYYKKCTSYRIRFRLYRELEELCYVRSKTERVMRLNALMNDHWFLDDFMETMSDTFGAELIFTIMDIYMQLLLLVYVIIWDTVVRRVFKDNAFPYISGVIESGIIIGKFIYLCYRCDSSVKEVIQMRITVVNTRNIIPLL